MSGDYKAISAAQGVGAKTAQGWLVELDKLGSRRISNLSGDVKAQARFLFWKMPPMRWWRLRHWGFSDQASLAVGKLDSGLDTETLIKQALKLLSKGK